MHSASILLLRVGFVRGWQEERFRSVFPQSYFVPLHRRADVDWLVCFLSAGRRVGLAPGAGSHTQLFVGSHFVAQIEA